MASTVRLDKNELDGAAHSVAEESSADDNPPHDEPTRSRWIGPAGTLLVVIVALVSVVVCLVAAMSWRSAVEDDRRDQDVLDVASSMAVNLVTLGQQTADADLARVIDGSTGDFREQFNSAADGFGSLLADGGVNSTGEVKSAGIVEASDERSTVLAAVTSIVKNNEAPDGEVRVYRMKLTLENIDNDWLVSNVEFVA